VIMDPCRSIGNSLAHLDIPFALLFGPGQCLASPLLKEGKNNANGTKPCVNLGVLGEE
jgi:hypothetical protein